jgi:hypothetical protein
MGQQEVNAFGRHRSPKRASVAFAEDLDENDKDSANFEIADNTYKEMEDFDFKRKQQARFSRGEKQPMNMLIRQ